MLFQASLSWHSRPKSTPGIGFCLVSAHGGVRTRYVCAKEQWTLTATTRHVHSNCNFKRRSPDIPGHNVTYWFCLHLVQSLGEIRTRHRRVEVQCTNHCTIRNLEVHRLQASPSWHSRPKSTRWALPSSGPLWAPLSPSSSPPSSSSPSSTTSARSISTNT